MKRNWKSFLSGCLTTLAVVGLVGTAAATLGKQPVMVDYNDIKVTLNGEQVVLVNAGGSPVEPFAINGTTYLPIRAVATALGLDVSWDSTTNTAVLSTPAAERAVYITRTGSKYHYDSNCNGGTYWEVPYETATGMGLEPCSKCVGSPSGSVDTDAETQAYAVVNDNVPFFQQTN